MENKLTTKQKIGLAVFIASLVFNVFLLIKTNRALNFGYRDGFIDGAYSGFKTGLETGRECITNGVAGECGGNYKVRVYENGLIEWVQE